MAVPMQAAAITRNAQFLRNMNLSTPFRNEGLRKEVRFYQLDEQAYKHYPVSKGFRFSRASWTPEDIAEANSYHELKIKFEQG
jgi:hypothetical protein